MGGRLTTHVLDIVQGRPASNVKIELWRFEPTEGGQELLKTVYATVDGRTDIPLLTDDELAIGMYELVFSVGEYFHAQKLATTTPPFLDRVPVRFNIADAEAYYHVPLLASPWAYSIYRGS